MKPKTLPIILIITGVAFLLGAVIFALDNATASEPVGLGKWIFDIFVALLGAGTGIKGWLDLQKKEKSEEEKTVSRVTAFDQGQVATSVGGRNVQANTYIETTILLESAPEIHDSIGYIPPAKTVTYIQRGIIENDVMEFLKNGGAGAIVGLHAPGGLGKTELAKHVIEEMKDLFDGVLWVDVGERTPQQVVADMLICCGVTTQPGADYETQKNELHYFLGRRCLLVVLDDVRQAALSGLSDFLPSKPCATLLTSRIQQIGGVNTTFYLDHMTEDQAFELMEAVLGTETVAAERESAKKLAARCAYNPLALEIAARRARQLQGIKKPIIRYFEIVQARFPELRIEGDDRWDMEKIFDTSYADLNEADRKNFRALAAFHPTGFSPEAANYVWEIDEGEARQALSRFINLSLVKVVEGERERYRLHDLLDEYAGKKLKESGEEAQVEIALAEWIINLFDEFYTYDRSTAPHVAEERANLLRSCDWARGQKNSDLLARLVTKSRNWFYVSFTEDWLYWIAWLEACLQLGISDKQLKANVLQAIGDVQQFRKEMDAALASYNEALTLFRAVGDRLGEANVLAALCRLSLWSGDIPAAEKQLEQVITMRRAIGDLYSEGADFGNFSIALLNLGQKEKAKDYALKAREAFERVGEPGILAQVDRLIEACSQGE